MSTEEKIYLYPVWLRIWHAFNALGILVLIYTGLNMQFAKPGFELIRFDLAVTLHNYAGIIVSISYLAFFIGNIVTSNSKYYKIKPKGLRKRLFKQIRYYTYGMFKNEEAPYPISEKRKFNPIQKYTYVVVMYLMVPIIIITGIALLLPELIIEEVYVLSGIFLTALLHAIIGFLISIFLIIHLYFATIGKKPLSNFKSILTGWH
ncbi:cytochrome B [Ancylomarina salipaludis]|uniref:Cytochrome B n=1 Tax=Ancylomarina salipaludis TaxID=2501299 RepID=A0A4Q1JNL0_9BACT|nr:cytochrome b/b6 domain-containing protein [Ancylomarina salipaludis]RXQ96480.1 cytochrome B [Ancylomarina salipaludis]